MATTSKTSTKSSATKTASKKTTVKAPIADAMTAIDTTNTPRAATTEPSVVETLSPVVVSNELRKKELFELVVARSGMKKKVVKPVVEAMLAVLAEGFAEQREMNLPPLGKMKVQRGKELHDGRALVLKLRQKSSQLNVAPAQDDSTEDE